MRVNSKTEDSMVYDDMQNMFDCVRFAIKTPEGEANIIIAETSPGKIYNIQFSIGKAGSTINAWAYALAECVVDSINRGADINDMIQLLSNITSSRPIFDKDGMACRSGPEALYIALFRYRNLYKAQNKKVEYSPHYNERITRNRHV